MREGRPSEKKEKYIEQTTERKRRQKKRKGEVGKEREIEENRGRGLG